MTRTPEAVPPTGIRTRLPLHRHQFREVRQVVAIHGDLLVEAHRYPSGVEALTVTGPVGTMVVLPYLGQMVWSLELDGTDMTMHNMFDMPRQATAIVDTYGCFAFHSGLLAAGCPGPLDDHPLHGEMACAAMDEAWLDLGDRTVTVGGKYEYVQGFGHHYLAAPTVTLGSESTSITIEMTVTNLSAAASMPLQYMCHMNHAYLPHGQFHGSIPESAFRLRESVPEHLRPTPAWTKFTDSLHNGDATLDRLDDSEHYDPEIVFFADDLPQWGDRLREELRQPGGPTFFTEFDSTEFPVATRWILHNPDQQVAAFCLPGTSRPEGRAAAEEAGTLIHLPPGETRSYSVTTGVSR